VISCRLSCFLVASQVETLVNASPATVSRAGIIFVSDTDLDWSPVVEGWILKRPAAEQPVFKELFSRFAHFPNVFDFCCFYDTQPTPKRCSLALSLPFEASWFGTCSLVFELKLRTPAAPFWWMQFGDKYSSLLTWGFEIIRTQTCGPSCSKEADSVHRYATKHPYFWMS